MTHENLITLSKEELLERMSRITDQLLLLSEIPNKQNEADKKRDEIHLLRQLLDEKDKIKRDN